MSSVTTTKSAIAAIPRCRRGRRVGLEARGTLSRGEFGLRWQQALETGGVLVGDEVRVSADIAAVCTSPHAEGAAA